MNPDRSPEENIRFMVRYLGLTEAEAEFIVAIETGEIDGDTVEIDEHGREVRQNVEETKQ